MNGKKNVFVVFDDSNPKSEIICDIIGEKGFGDVVVKRKRLENLFRENLCKIFENFSWHVLKNIFELNLFAERLKNFLEDEIYILHCFSNFIFNDEKKALTCFEKIFFIDSTYRVMEKEKCAAIMFNSKKEYLNFVFDSLQKKSTFLATLIFENSFKIEGLCDISLSENFIQCITGNFDARFFNSLLGNEYEITKSSANKEKIRSEYSFYHLLPDDMKKWFVLPYDFSETENSACYKMERLHIPNLAIKYVHGSFSEEDFFSLMEKYFYFFKHRHSKKISKEEYEKIRSSLYEKKILERVEKLKSFSQFEKIKDFIFCGTKEKSIGVITKKYFLLKEKIESKTKFPLESAIGHGDPCFANALYNKSSQMLKFVDPKGALCEKELWTNPYYDVAKLSHSVCGLYDFFNNSLFKINVNSDFKCNLQIDFDNSKYKAIFRKMCEKNGFDFLAVRLYEASLFISMLPLHIDFPLKVFGFVLNAIKILDEVESEMKN